MVPRVIDTRKHVMSDFTPANAAVWFEIPVTDMNRSKGFYEAVLGNKLTLDETGPNPMAIFNVENLQAGVSGHLYPGEPSKDGKGNTVHLAAPDPLEDALKRVTENGGQVKSDVIAIPAGRFAYCQDPDGNSIGIFGR